MSKTNNHNPLNIKHFITAATCLTLSLALTGCNIVEGVGKEISAIGSGISTVSSDLNPYKPKADYYDPRYDRYDTAQANNRK